MKFGEVRTEDAAGAILAHSLKAGKTTYKKGHTLTPSDIAAIKAFEHTLVVARLEDTDVSENDAARELADALSGSNIKIAKAFTGRANLIAGTNGVIKIDANVMALNAVDEAITLATLPNFARVAEGQMIGTVKIIPYGVPRVDLDAAILAAKSQIELHPFRPLSTHLILTETPSLKKSLTAKAETVLRDRLTSLGIDDVTVAVTSHTTPDVAQALAETQSDLVLILGGSATSDRKDVCPSAVLAAGGSLERFGMPVDPGNLLFLGAHEGRPVIGLPGCVRSPALNGADWVLERIVAGLEVTGPDIAAMGVGGLLKEIPTRPQPRLGK